MPTEKITLRPAVRKFAEAMERGLREMSEQGEKLEDRHAEELILLIHRTEIQMFSSCSYKAIGKYCVDVANFSMMLYDNIKKGIR